MSRKQDREQAFFIIFEKGFTDERLEDLIESAKLARGYQNSDFTEKILTGVFSNIEALDVHISRHSKGWKISRLSKVSLAILRLAIFEILYMEDIPVSVSINEAVDLAKKYAGEEDASYINGVLGAVAKQCADNSD